MKTRLLANRAEKSMYNRMAQQQGSARLHYCRAGQRFSKDSSTEFDNALPVGVGEREGYGCGQLH